VQDTINPPPSPTIPISDTSESPTAAYYSSELLCNFSIDFESHIVLLDNNVPHLSAENDLESSRQHG
jgi:hypothetical protein